LSSASVKVVQQQQQQGLLLVLLQVVALWAQPQAPQLLLAAASGQC
jgi:hypothetical protein